MANLPIPCCPTPIRSVYSPTPQPHSCSHPPSPTPSPPPPNPPPAESVKLDQFVVTGEWGALQSSIETRRQSLRLTDSVTANDLGILPDFNIGENLQRIPGISVDLDQAEARYVTVRGFSPNYTSTTINGSMIAATERNTRRLEMDAMPASLASSIDVTKTQTPDLEGHSVGGSIDIKGPRAIRGRPITAKVNAKIGTYTNDEGYRGSGPSGTADVLLTRTFMQGKMGLAVSGNYYLRDSYTPQQESGSSRYWFDNTGTRVAAPYGGNGYAVPVERRQYWYHNKRERKGGSVKWEFNPSSALHLWALGFYNTATDDEVRQTDLLTWNTSTRVTNQTATSGTLTQAAMLSQQFLGKFDFERTIGGVQTGADAHFGDHTVSARLNYSGSFFNNPENWNEWRQSGSQLAVNYRQVGQDFQIEDVNPAAPPQLRRLRPVPPPVRPPPTPRRPLRSRPRRLRQIPRRHRRPRLQSRRQGPPHRPHLRRKPGPLPAHRRQHLHARRRQRRPHRSEAQPTARRPRSAHGHHRPDPLQRNLGRPLRRESRPVDLRSDGPAGQRGRLLRR
jgi:hypothetical protein